MYDRILFPTDGSEGANAVLEYAVDLAQGLGSELHLLYVADTARDSVTMVHGEVVDALEQKGAQIVAEAAEQAEPRGVPTVTEVIQGRVPETITEYAESFDIDVIMMPTKGRTGLERLFMGSTTDRVLRQAAIPVLTIPPESKGRRFPYSNILFPTDGSDAAAAALEEAIELAQATEATLHILSVIDVEESGFDLFSDEQIEASETRAREIVEEAERTATNTIESVRGTVELDGSVVSTTQRYLEEHDIDLVVMGRFGRGGLERYLVGSTTEKLVRSSSVPVMTVRPSDV